MYVHVVEVQIVYSEACDQSFRNLCILSLQVPPVQVPLVFKRILGVPDGSAALLPAGIDPISKVFWAFPPLLRKVLQHCSAEHAEQKLKTDPVLHWLAPHLLAPPGLDHWSLDHC